MQTLPAVRRVSTPTPVEGIGIEALSRPARTLTGDFYFTHRERNRVWFAVGDVAGKGLPAAVVMAMIQEELEERITSCAAASCAPERTMARLQEFLLDLLPKNRFATAVIGSLGDDGSLVLANAGHCPPLVVRNDGTIEQLVSTGPVLGILRKAAWHSIATTLGESETVLLYSDGVIEARREGEEIGVTGLVSLLRETGPSPAAIAGTLECTADDLTLVAIRRNRGVNECETVVM